MKITLVSMGFDGEFIENLGIARIKAYLDSKDQRSEIVYFKNGENIDDVIKRIDVNSQLIGFSVYARSILTMMKIADALKKRNNDCKIFVGSKYVTSYYRDILNDSRMDSIDYIVLGDGEYSIEQLFKCMVNDDDLELFVSNHKHIASRKSMDDKIPLAIEINELPLPNRDLLNEKNQFHAYICDAHGCCERCSFCAQGCYYNKWNGRSSEDIYKEIKLLHDTTEAIFYDFTAGSFEDPGKLGKDKIHKLCDYILNDNLKLTLKCYLRTNTFQDTDEDIQLLKKMKQAGFNCVFVGMEAGNEKDLCVYNKNTTVEQNKQMYRLLKEANIYSGSFGFIMLNPYSDLDTIKKNYEFLVDIKSHNFLTYFNRIIAYTGTAISEKIKEDGLFIETDFLLQVYAYKFVNPRVTEIEYFINDHFTIGEINQVVQDTDLIPSFMNQLYTFLEDGEKYIEQLNSCLDSFALVFKDYFGILYLENDLELCVRKFPEFKKVVVNLDKNLVLLYRKFMKRLIQKKIIKTII